MKIDHFIKKYGSILLFAVCIVAFWQLAFLQNGMKWDFVDAYLPARYFFSEAVLNNTFPFWNPYMLYGVPFYADLVSVFNPEFWLVANMFGYSNITLQYVFLAYVFLAGVNFRYFLQRFQVNEPLALSLAIAYMLSGFTVGNAQHLGFIAGYALLPLVVATYEQFARQPETRSLARLSLVFLLMVFSSYPGITIILSYLLLGIFIYYLVLSIKKKERVKRFLAFHLILASVVLVGTSVLLLAYSQAQPYLSRYSGLTLEAVLRHPFTLRSFWSFLFPYTTTTDVAFFNTDPSMSNAYFGLFSLLFLIHAFTNKVKQKIGIIFLLFAVFALLTALGNQFFLREFLYDYFPFMNMFKYPSIFRALSIFGFLVYAGLNCSIDDFLSLSKKRLLVIIALVILFILFVVVRSVGKLESVVLYDFDLSLAERLQKTTINEAAVLQGIIHLLLLGCFFLVLAFGQKQKYLPAIVVILFALDGIISTQLNLHYTVVNDIDPVEFKAYLDSEPKGFPIPGLHPIGENSDNNASNKFVWRNNNVFPKRPTFDGLVSFKTDGYKRLSDDFPELMEAMKLQPLFFFSDDVRTTRDTAGTGQRTVLISSSDMQIVKGKTLQTHQTDRLKITRFSPNKVSLITATKNDQFLVFQQNFYTGWQLTIDGRRQEVYRVNYALMGTLVPGGEHDIQFSYSNQPVILFFVLSMLLILVLASLLLFLFWQDNKERRPAIFWTTFGVLILFVALSITHRYRYQQNRNGLLKEIRHNFETLKNNDETEVTTFLSYASATDFELPGADYQFCLDGNLNIAAFGKVLAETQKPRFALGWVNGTLSAEAKALFASYFAETRKEKIFGNSGFIIADRGKNQAYQFTEDFEAQTNSPWATDKNRYKIDSVTANSYYTFMPNEEWGASLKITVDEGNSGPKKLTVLGDLRFPDLLSEVNLVVVVSRGDEQMEYYSRSVNDFMYKTGIWSRFSVVKTFDFNLGAGDIVHIYLWNRTKGPFDVDNLKVKTY